MQDNLTSVEVHKGNSKMDFIGQVENNFLAKIFCYINDQESAIWKCYSFEHEKQIQFLKMILEEHGMKETYIKEYSQNIMTCFENGIDCILK